MDYKQLDHFFFGSKTRINILVMFVVGLEEELYLREISRKIKVSAGNTRRELLILEKAGILQSRKEANLKYYSLSTDNPVYRPFCEIIIKTAGIPALLKLPLDRNGNIIMAFIYGSYARGNFDNKSDIDLFVLTDKNHKVFGEISAIVDKLERKFGREINVDIMEHKEFITKMKQKNSYLMDIIEGKKIFLKGGIDDIRPKVGDAAKS